MKRYTESTDSLNRAEVLRHIRACQDRRTARQQKHAYTHEALRPRQQERAS